MMHEKEESMNISVKRITVCAFLALALVFTMIPLSQPANAAADRSVSGSVTMPASRTITLAQGKATKINFGTEYDTTHYYYYKIVPTKTGYITVTSDFIHGSNVALCGADKKLASRGNKNYDDFYSAGSQYAWQTTLKYGVKKGKTYYIRVKGASTEKTTDEYENYADKPYIGTMKWTNTAVTGLKYGATKKKSSLIKRNKTRKGVIKAGSTKAQWYKISTKRKKIKISFSAKNNCGTLYAKVYYKSYGKWYSSRMYAMRSTDGYKSACTLTKSSKKRTTYYIKVYPDYRTSGAYTLKWK